MMHHELDKGGLLAYDDAFLLEEEADQLFEFLKRHVSWEHKFYTDRRTGRQFPQPRLTAWYADDPNMAYSYSGITQVVQPWISELLQVKEKVEAVSGAKYNSVLLNYYRDGKDSVGLHADDEKELGETPNIASISLGATRLFRLRKNVDNSCVDNYLSHGSLLIMSGTTQQYWKHEVPKDPYVQDGRINLTFRKFYVP